MQKGRAHCLELSGVTSLSVARATFNTFGNDTIGQFGSAQNQRSCLFRLQETGTCGGSMLGYPPITPSYGAPEEATSCDECQQSEAEQGVRVHQSELSILGHGTDIPLRRPCNDAAEIHSESHAKSTGKRFGGTKQCTTSAFLYICSSRCTNSGQQPGSATS